MAIVAFAPKWVSVRGFEAPEAKALGHVRHLKLQGVGFPN